MASTETGVASVEIPLLAGLYKLKLSPGTYPSEITSEKANCTINIRVIGMYAMLLWLYISYFTFLNFELVHN